MGIPKAVNICECWARDGIQGHPKIIPTEKKIEMINRMMDIGFKRVEVTSFSHPKLLPQFADCLDVLKGVNRRDDINFIAIVPNEKALERLFDAAEKGYGVHEITAIISASEDHLLANLEMTFAEVMPGLSNIVKRARQNGIKVIGCIGTSFGCPLSGNVPIEKVIELTDWYLQQGATSIMLGDTTGEANPLQVREVYSKMKSRFPGVDFIAHFHDTRGMGVANTLAALQEGIVYHDCSIGGMGGQPATKRPKYHKGFAGNTCTEDMVGMMNEMGIATGIDLNNLLDLAVSVEGVCGQELKGQITKSGPVRHRSERVFSPALLRVGQEISPAIFLYDPDEIKGPSNSKELCERIIRNALENNWPVPANIEINLSGLNVDSGVTKRAVLVTRFFVTEIFHDRVALKVLSQKSNGDVYMDGNITIDTKLT